MEVTVSNTSNSGTVSNLLYYQKQAILILVVSNMCDFPSFLYQIQVTSGGDVGGRRKSARKSKNGVIRGEYDIK